MSEPLDPRLAASIEAQGERTHDGTRVVTYRCGCSHRVRWYLCAYHQGFEDALDHPESDAADAAYYQAHKDDEDEWGEPATDATSPVPEGWVEIAHLPKPKYILVEDETGWHCYAEDNHGVFS